jgi:predicted phosphoribosyltransferase
VCPEVRVVLVRTRRRQPLSWLDGPGRISECGSLLGSRLSSGIALPPGGALSVAVAALELDELVLIGVARGGVAVAVARELAAPLTAINIERVNAYGSRLGAVTADGPPYLRERHGVPEEDVESALERSRRAAQALEARLEHETLPVAGRTTRAARVRPPSATT